ncbi:MAG: DUF5050 domain-containing protein, partial [Clostridiales bacterium]|nr:DUF5050 domain-containing protein [Clostridiales bacterium]
MRQKLSVLFCFFILAAWFSGCSRADDNTAADLNLLNTSVAELDGTIYFMTDDRKDLYALEETQGGTTARMVLKDIQANSIASHGAYLYFYRCNSTETAVYYLPVDGGSYQPIQLENFNRRIDSWNGELGDDKWTYMCIIGDYIYLDAYEMGFLSTHITLTSDQPVLEIEHLPAQESSALSTVHWMRTNFVMQSDTPYWTLSSNHTPIREVYLSNYDDTYY